MPSGRSYNFLLQSLAVFVFYLTKILSKIDHHQVLKANVGQDITMSCIFDENKIEQVKIKSTKNKQTMKYIASVFSFYIRKK